MARGNRGGRVLPHERNTNNNAPILGADLNIAGYEEAIHETNKFEISDNTRKDYRRRIVRITKHWKEKYPEYHSVGVRDVSPAELQDKTLYYYNRYKTDLIYTGLNVKFVIKYLLDTKEKEGGKIKAANDVRKYKDAICWGSSVRNEPLHEEFYRDIESYIKSYKKEAVQAKKEGRVEEKSADPISTTLFLLILSWAIQENNIYLWFWTLTQWTCMARCASIDALAFHNFSLGSDSIKCKYDDAKANKDGEKLSEKNIFANPYDYKQCWWTAFGVYCCIESSKLTKDEKLFLNAGAKLGTASSRYQEQLLGLMKKKKDIVSQHIRWDHANAYGLRKGSATHATSGTTCTPSLPSIARRGEWSMGQVLDVYWHFCQSQDLFLGRILGGLDPTKASFGVLPAHFTVIDPLNDADIKKAADMCFGRLMTKYQGQPHDPAPLLLRGLASIVHQSEQLIAVCISCPGHKFNEIPVLHDRQLLHRLRSKVTLEPTPGVMTHATGIPPHVDMAIESKVIFYTCVNIIHHILYLTFLLFFLSENF